MTPQEFTTARQTSGLGRRDFGRLLGYTGEARNIYMTVKRYELGTGKGGRVIPPTIERLIRLMMWFHADYGYFPDPGAIADRSQAYPTEPADIGAPCT